MRTVDLALYADSLAAAASTLAARLERERGALRQAAIEREARQVLDEPSRERLEHLGHLRPGDGRLQHAHIARLSADLAAVEELQAWVEARLFEAREDAVSPVRGRNGHR